VAIVFGFAGLTLLVVWAFLAFAVTGGVLAAGLALLFLGVATADVRVPRKRKAK